MFTFQGTCLLNTVATYPYDTSGLYDGARVEVDTSLQTDPVDPMRVAISSSEETAVSIFRFEIPHPQLH
jgi:hypothetical protein